MVHRSFSIGSDGTARWTCRRRTADCQSKAIRLTVPLSGATYRPFIARAHGAAHERIEAAHSTFLEPRAARPFGKCRES